jgi:hypothetical protein
MQKAPFIQRERALKNQNFDFSALHDIDAMTEKTP